MSEEDSTSGGDPTPAPAPAQASPVFASVGSSDDEVAPVNMPGERARRSDVSVRVAVACAAETPYTARRVDGTADNVVRGHGAAGAEKEAVGEGDMESIDEEERLQRYGVDWSVVDSGSDDGSGMDTPRDAGVSHVPAVAVRGQKPRGLNYSEAEKARRFSTNDTEFGTMRIPVRTRTKVFKEWGASAMIPSVAAPWVSLDGKADRSGRRAFPPGATRSEKRKWRKTMRLLKKAMPSIMEAAARAAADGALHSQTLATDEAARRARSEARGAKLVYVYVYVKSECKTCRGMVYVGKRCAEDYAALSPTAERGFDVRDDKHRYVIGIGNSGRQPTKLDTHYQKHPPMSFWRTLVYSYVGPHGDLPTRMAVAAVERAVWKVLDDAGMTGLNSALPPISVLPLTPFVREDSDQWRAVRTELMVYKEERGDMRVHDGCSLGARMRRVRLERGLGDAAEEQWLTDEGFDWEPDQESREKRNLCARQWHLVRDMIAWMETNDGE
ncbi:hypothetical protein I4F81_012648 [Pyropia yezoensis]|uniref:Uncharacterized protein n=1 Tax=Pyropia yezoensis TaxID=2788 RepID=A0ACC3CJX9_PYRYE|nr:hypothetical protein I4F81_012648 [Neopyropia yezoensis]